MRLSPFLRSHSAATRVRVAVTLACCATLAVGAAAARPASAQTPRDGRASSTSHATRTQLESLVTVAERQASTGKDRERQRKRDEAGRLRERLRAGDFQAGDQIVLDVQGEPTLSDTFSVRAPRQLLLPGAAPIALDGVLRSELTEHLTKELSRYLKSPAVRATSLVRLQITGQVARPGYYAMPSDVLVSDAIMIAGGPTASGDLKKISINRGDQEVMDQGETQEAIRGGLTLDQLNVRAGDEVLVGELKRRSVGTAVQVLAGIATIAFGVIAATR